jgi:hypothetical protein
MKTKLGLYILSNISIDKKIYYSGMLIVASRKEGARRLAEKKDDGVTGTWKDETITSCRQVGWAKKGALEGVIELFDVATNKV